MVYKGKIKNEEEGIINMFQEKMLITAPFPSKSDIEKKNFILSYLSVWIKEIAKNKNINPKCFFGKDVHIGNIESYLKKGKPRLVMFCGHGGVDKIKGQDEEDIITKDNDYLLSSKIVYSVSCYSSQELGRHATSSNIYREPCEAFIGFNGVIGIYWDERYSKPATPEKDIYTELFKKFFNSVIIFVLKGFSVSESVKKTKKLVDNLKEEYKQKFPEIASIATFQLEVNKNALEVLGNPNAKL